MDEGINERKEVFGQLGLAPVEHFLFGSSVSYQDKIITGKDFIELFKRGELPTDFFIPQILQVNKSKIENVNKEREQKKYLAGYLSVFDVEAQVEMMNRGMSIGLELPQVDNKTGEIVPNWRIRLLDRKRNIYDNSKDYDVLAIDEEMSDCFEIEKNDNGYFLKLKNEI